MREVIPQRLWLGNAGDARNPGRVLDAGITAVVNLAGEELPPNLPRDVIYCHFPVVDGPDNPPQLLEIAIRTVATLLEEEVPTLVYCEEGMSRSLALTAAAISRWRGQTPEAALKSVIGDAPHDVSTALWHDIRALVAATG